MNIYKQVDKLAKAVVALEEYSKEVELKPDGILTMFRLAQVNFLKKKLQKRAEKLIELAKSGEAFK